MIKRLLLASLIFIAVALPWQISYNALPVSSYINELFAILGWGVLIVIAGLKLPGPPTWSRSFIHLGLFFGLLAALVLIQGLTGFARLWSVCLLWLYFLAGAFLCACVGYQLAFSDRCEYIVDVFSVCWVLGGLLSVAAELSQYFQLDVSWYVVAPLSQLGRIYGNIRQPNHLATLLTLALVCAAWLYGRRRLGLAVAVPLLMMLAIGVVLSSSRTGMLIMGVLALLASAWGGARERIAVVAGLLGCAGLFILLSTLDSAGVFSYFGAERLATNLARPSDASGSRFDLWANTLYLIKENWLWGAGVQQFQFLYLLSDIPIPTGLYTNAHSLPLQIAVEFGLPAACVLFYCLLASFWKARNALASDIGRWCLAAMLAMLVHSLFEFPLWYAYFLFPFAFFWGLFAGRGASPQLLPADGAEQRSPEGPRQLKWLALGGVVMVSVVLTSVTHYLSLAAIYAPGGLKDTFSQRMETADRGFFYRHWIVFTALNSYAIPNAERSRQLVGLFDQNARFFMNEEYLLRYAIVLTHTGQLERAKRVANALGTQRTPSIFALKVYCDAQKDPAFQALSAYISNPYTPAVQPSDFP
ncbi:MAG: O-antigen ligase C-terminal domain-containing protein [Burkholderiales bacterium]|nr:O-antigen ligase C-terminal domain-containing protein [Burkholderiales bacterium]